LRDALCGLTVNVPTLDGTTIPLKITEVIKPNMTKRISGQGLPNPKLSGRRGDLIIEFDVKFPEKLESSIKEILRDTLPTTI
jgi:DnaJ-class molecular chaperone